MAKVRVEYDDKRLRRNVRNFDSNLRSAVRSVVDRHALETTTYLKTHARWTDRTGAARSGLVAIPIHGRTFEEIYMAYSVNYGIWLEVAHDRKYAIITPTQRIMGDLLLKRLSHLIDRMNLDK